MPRLYGERDSADQYEILELARFSITGLRDRERVVPSKRDRRQLMDWHHAWGRRDDGFEFDEDGEIQDWIIKNRKPWVKKRALSLFCFAAF